MAFAFDWLENLGPTGIVLKAIFVTLAGIGLLLAYILGRRAWRRRQFRIRDRRVVFLRRNWEKIVSGEYPPEQWRFEPLDCEIVESILLDTLEATPPDEDAPLLKCIRDSGLVDKRIFEARTQRGWRRRQALVSIGRMRLPEVIPVLAEALDDSDERARIAAVRGLGRLSVPEAAIPLLDQFIRGDFDVPTTSLQNALISCARWKPTLLLPYLRRADDGLRPVLARVLGEIATGDLANELLILAGDPLPEVRASAARALAEVPAGTAISALTALAGDSEWFVRLRAVVALGNLRDARAIPILVETLCDRNRYVRLRSAMALAGMPAHWPTILPMVKQKRDQYALQALISQIERSGTLLEIVSQLRNPDQRAEAEKILLAALRAGASRLLLSMFFSHRAPRARVALARLLARSAEQSLIVPLEKALSVPQPPRQSRMIRWLLHRLRSAAAPTYRAQLVRAS
jgi:HEAT repeat protein